jgi:septal ring factor EnvC (AmiA/AmiB activator)
MSGTSLPLSRALFCAALLFCTSLTVQAQSSPLILPGSEQIWETLLQTTKDLPTQFDSFTDSLTTQLNSLQDSNANLLSTNSDLMNSNVSLAASNAQLKTSNQSLQRKNEDLTQSLKASSERVVTLEGQLAQSQKDLESSIASTILAQDDAKALAARLGIIRIGVWTFGIIAVGEAAYIAGSLLKWW